MIARKTLLPALFLLILSGCSSPVRYKISGDFSMPRAATVAVLPVSGVVDDARVKDIFRNTAAKKLQGKNYNVLPFEYVDGVYVKYGSSSFEKMTPSEVSGLINADSILSIRITGWEEDLFLSYASLKIKAEFTLYSDKGVTLWQAAYSTKESDMGLDRELLKFGVLKAYEARIERIVGAAFVSLPSVPRPEGPGVKEPGIKEKKEEEQKKFFDWLG